MVPSAILISNKDDPRIAPYVSVRERDLTGGTDGMFLVEGKVPLSILLTRSRFALHSLFLCETRLAPLADLLRQVPSDVPIYTASQSIMDDIAGFPIHRGVLACAKKGAGLDMTDLTSAKRLLVLNQISNHDNVGAAFRNAAAFGQTASCSMLGLVTRSIARPFGYPPAPVFGCLIITAGEARTRSKR